MNSPSEPAPKLREATPYDYAQLSTPRSIRILKLRPLEHGTADLHCTLIVASLDDPDIEYEALSYTWGAPDTDHTLHVDLNTEGGPASIPLPITWSIWRALRDLSLPHQERCLWADSVCINQADNAEKSSQITLMRHIYGTAARTVVHIGKSFWCHDYVQHLIQCLHRDPHLSTNGCRELGLHPAKPPDVYRFRTDWGKSMKAIDLFPAWIELLSRPWFTRVWVIQEIAMAKEISIETTGVVICGGSKTLLTWDYIDKEGRLTWDHFIDAVALTRKDEWNSYRSTNETLNKRYRRGGTCAVLMQMVRQSRLMNERPTLLYFLNHCRVFDATNPRDRLYALLGLAVESDEPVLRPNYDEDVDVTLHRYAVFFARQKDNCLELLYDDRRHDGSTMPSWVPDWTASTFIRGKRLAPSPLWKSAADSDVYCAGGEKKKAEIRDNESGRIMYANGLLLDEIVFVGNSYETSPTADSEREPFKNEISYLRELDDLLQHPDIHLPNNESTEEAAWRISRGDCTDHSPGKLTEYLEHHQLRRKGFIGNYLSDPDAPRIYAALRREIAPPDVFSLHPYVTRRLGRSKQGHVCQLPLTASSGDVLAIFLGSCVPHVLRRSGQGWRLVGDAYVHGVMRGEAMGQGKGKIEAIELI